MTDFQTPACDWMTIRHDYPHEVPPRNGGNVMKITPDGEVEWLTASWESIHCPSSDTSIRIKCDGRHLYATGNIGRFQQQDNREGLTVDQCVQKWRDYLQHLDFDMTGFGQRHNQGLPNEWGTVITRVDLCHNFNVSDYAAFVQACMVRRIGQKLPMLGKYGPTWGYDAKRGSWWKAKIYDKDAELAGKRRSEGGATLARFEIQLGSEYLKREKLHIADNWVWDRHRGEIDMARIIYGGFARQVFAEQTNVQDWTDIPPRLRQWAILWRDGVDCRTQMSKSAYYRARSQLREEYGIDIGAPCNVTALVRRSRVVEVSPVNTLRQVA